MNVTSILRKLFFLPDKRALEAIGSSKINLSTMAAAGICLLTTFVVCLLHNLNLSMSIRISLFDSGHYLESCRQTAIVFQSFLFPHQALPLATKVNEYLMLDGPVLPVLFGGLFTFMGRIPVQTDWQIFIAIQCFLHALSSALVCLLVLRRFTGSGTGLALGLCAGLFWGLYPPAVIACHYVLQEELACLLLLLIVYILSQCLDATSTGHSPSWLVVSAGFCDGLVLMTKPALVFALLAVNVLPWQVSWRERLRYFGLLVCGFLVVIVPWIIFAHTVTGKIYVSPQRDPVLNTVTGCNLEHDGWGAFPIDSLNLLFSEKDNSLSVAMGMWSNHPRELLNLILRKVPRLFAVPWNDFRESTFGLPFGLQVWWHRLVLLLGLLGIITLSGTKQKDEPRRFIGLSCLLVVLGHFAYLPFECSSRYGYTAMPFVFILAFDFLDTIISSGLTRKAGLLLAAPLVVLLFLFGFDLLPFIMHIVPQVHLAAAGRFAIILIVFSWLEISGFLVLKNVEAKHYKVIIFLVLLWLMGAAILFAFTVAYGNNQESLEWSCKLHTGQSACRNLSLGGILSLKDRSKVKFALILIDGDKSLSDARVSVNEHDLNEKLVSIYMFDSHHYQLLNVIQLASSALNRRPEEIRQWRAVTVPLKWLNLNGENCLKIAPGASGKVTIYGDYLSSTTKRRPFLSPEYFSFGKLWGALSTVDTLDGRLPDPVGLRAIRSSCWLEDSQRKQTGDDLSFLPGKQTGQYRLYLVLGIKQGAQAEKSMDIQKASQESLVVKLKADDFSPKLVGNVDGSLRFSRQIIGGQACTACTVSIPEECLTMTHLKIRVSGQLASQLAGGVMNVVVFLSGAGKGYNEAILSSTPKAFVAKREFQPFVIDDEVARQAVNGGISSIRLELYPVAGTISVRNLSLDVLPEQKPDFVNHFVSIL